MKGHARQLMTSKVVVASPDMPLAEAARELGRLEISGLPVVDSAGEVVGILTETDVLIALLDAAAPETPIRKLMTMPVVTVDEFASTDQVVQLLKTRGFHHLPVTRRGEVVGMITPQDVVRYFVDHELPTPPDVA